MVLKSLNKTNLIGFFVCLFALNGKCFANWDIKGNVCVQLKSAPNVDTVYKVTLSNDEHHCATFANNGDFSHESNEYAVGVLIKSGQTKGCNPSSESGLTIRSYGGLAGRCASTKTYFTASLAKGPYVPAGYPTYTTLISSGQQWFQMDNQGEWVYQRYHSVSQNDKSKTPPAGTKGLFFSDIIANSYWVSLNGSDTITMTYFPDGT